MTKVLVTGFEAFGPYPVNPTEAAVRSLPQVLSGAQIITGVLPVEFGRCADAVLALVAEHRPDAVILTGLAAGRSAITPERIAVNLRDTGGTESFADNAGYAPVDVPIVDGGPDGIFSTLPNRQIVARLQAAGIPAEISGSAGAFACNETMYAVLTSLASAAGPQPPAGFIHVPDVDVLPLAQIVRALEVVIDTVVASLGEQERCRPGDRAR